MASNDEVVLGIPHVQCPSCQCTFDLSLNRFDKFTKAQRRKMREPQNGDSCRTSQPWSMWNAEDQASDAPEKNYVVVSCGNMTCDQYNKFKVLELPRIVTPSVKVGLE